MWSPRAQNDRMLFAAKWREMLEKTTNLDFYQDMVKGLLINENKANGVKTGLGHDIYADSVVLTNGTFLNGNSSYWRKKFWGRSDCRKSCYWNYRTIGFSWLRKRPT